MRGPWVVVVWAVVAASVAEVATTSDFDNRRFEEPVKDLKKLTTFFLKPILDQWPSSIKQKRCSYNLKSPNVRTSNLKLRLEQHKTDALCKYCKKSEMRMKSALCKKCIENSQEITPRNTRHLQRSPAVNANENQVKITNKFEDRKTEMEPNTQKLKLENARLNSLKTNSNERESVFRLIKSPFGSKQSMKTLQMPPATKTTEAENMRLSQPAPTKLRDSNPTIAEFLANFPFYVPSTSISEENINKLNRDLNNNLQPASFQDNKDDNLAIFENSRNKRLKDIRNLTHNDFMNILKQALRSEENPNSIEIIKRDSNHTEHTSDNKKSSDILKKELLNDILSKHILELSSESEEISDLIDSSFVDPTINTLANTKASNLYSTNYNLTKFISKKTTEELSTEQYNSTTILQPADIVSLTKDTNDRNQIGNVYHSRFNYKKHPREKLQYRNREWRMEKELPDNKMPFAHLEEILAKIAPEKNNTNITDVIDNSTNTGIKSNLTNSTTEGNEIISTAKENSIIFSQKLNNYNKMPFVNPDEILEKNPPEKNNTNIDITNNSTNTNGIKSNLTNSMIEGNENILTSKKNSIILSQKLNIYNKMPFTNPDEILKKNTPDNSNTNKTYVTDNNFQDNSKENIDIKSDSTKLTTERNEMNTTGENSIILSQKFNIGNIISPSPTKDTKIDENIVKRPPDLFKGIRNQYFRNKHLYLKNPRLQSTYENGKHKYLRVHKNFTNENWNILNNSVTTESSISSNLPKKPTDSEIFNNVSSFSQTFVDDNHLLKSVNSTKNTYFEIKKISTRPTRDLTTQEKDNIFSQINTKLNSRQIKPTASNKVNNNGIIREVLPTKLSKPNNLKSPLLFDKQHDIFRKNLNMNPKINSNKYKNIALSMKNNETPIESPSEQLNQEIKIVGNKNYPNINENFSSDEIKTLHNYISNDVNTLNDLETVLGQENDNNINQSSASKNNNIRLTENKINLPLILKQNEDGTIQLILDRSEICQKCAKTHDQKAENEKYVFKRKTEDNLAKYPLNIFNILEKHHDQSSTHVNNYLQMPNDPNKNGDLKKKFYQYLINEQLFKLFKSLNIPVDSSTELHTYVDDLPEKEKNKLKQYLLNNISSYYTTKDGNNFNEELMKKKQAEFMQNLINKQNINNNIKTTTEPNNRISLKIKSEDDLQTNNLNYNDGNILKSLIHEGILKEIRNSNLCPACNNQKCGCHNNDRTYFPRDDYSDDGRVIDKRHYTHYPVNENSFNIDSDDLKKKKYKIVNNFLNWARDIVVHK